MKVSECSTAKAVVEQSATDTSNRIAHVKQVDTWNMMENGLIMQQMSYRREELYIPLMGLWATWMDLWNERVFQEFSATTEKENVVSVLISWSYT